MLSRLRRKAGTIHSGIQEKQMFMKITHPFTIIFSAIILATGCASNQERQTRSSERSSVDYGDTASYASSANSLSRGDSASAGSQSYTPGANQTAAATSTPGAGSDSDRQLTAQVQQQLNSDPA